MAGLGRLLGNRFLIGNSRLLVEALALIAVIALAGFAGIFRYLDAGLEDALMRSIPAGSEWQTQVAVIESVPEGRSEQQQLHEALLRMRPRAIVWIGEVPQRAQGQDGAVPVLGVASAASGTPAEYPARQFDALAYVMEPEFGFYRRQGVRLSDANGGLPPLEVAVLRMLGRENAVPLEAYRLNFRLPARALARLDADSLLQGQIIDNVVSGKVVLVGAAQELEVPRWLSPIAPHARGFSQLEFHAYALETLLADRVLVAGEGLHAIAAVVLAGLFSLLCCALLVGRLGLWLILPLLLLALAVWITAFIVFDLYPPLTSQLLTIFSVVVLFRLHLAHRRSHIIQRLASQAASRVEGRLSREHDPAEDEEWSRIVAMVSQMLNLQRCIFLTVRGDEQHVREVASLGCSLDDICELRRDYQRSPYTDALEERNLIQLDRRLFLRDEEGRPEEDQYMMPVLLEGELQGFWCLTVARDQVNSTKELARRIRPFANQIAQRMYHMAYRRNVRGVVQDRQLSAGELEPELRLGNLVTLLESRINLFESLFHGLSTATILYDVFGRVQQVNKEMTLILDSEDFRSYEKTALEMLVELGGVPVAEARDHLRYVVVDDGRVSLPSQIRLGGSSYHMQLSPVTAFGESEGVESRVDARGVVFELQDMSEFEGQYQGRENFVEQLIVNLRNHCSSLMMLRRLLSRAEGEARPARAMGKFNDTLDAIMKELERAQEFLEQPVSGAVHKEIPLVVGMVVREALDQLDSLQESRGLEVRFDEPLLPSLAIAARDALRDGLVSVLQFLIEDAREDTELCVIITETERTVRLQIENEGFGIPQETLSEFISGNDPDTSEVFIRIGQLSDTLEGWGGLLHAYSQVGKGCQFLLALPKMI